MYHYDPQTALEELSEDNLVPDPVRLRDMILRADLSPEQALQMNRSLASYLELFGGAQKTARTILEVLSEVPRRR